MHLFEVEDFQKLKEGIFEFLFYFSIIIIIYFIKEKKLLFLQVPLLEIDGKNLVQSSAIARYICRKGKLLGDNDDETTKYKLS